MPTKWVKVDQAQAGMVLALPISDEMGRVLLHKGEELEEHCRERLAAWSIGEVPIEIPDDGLPVPPIRGGRPLVDATDSQVIKLTDLRLQQRFAPWEGDETMLAVQRVARRKLVRRRTERRPTA